MLDGNKTAPENFVLGDDLPKENPWRDDRLGYTPFCERLSKVIINLRVPNGYVIGLHGEWGSGKSTALNFVDAFLKKTQSRMPRRNGQVDAGRVPTMDCVWTSRSHSSLL